MSSRSTRARPRKLSDAEASRYEAAAPAEQHGDVTCRASRVHGTLAFVGQATAGEFAGVTALVSGCAEFDAELRDAHGWVTTPVASIRTGHWLGDYDVRRSLDAAAHPLLRFDLDHLSTQPQTDGEESDAPPDGVRRDGASDELATHDAVTLVGRLTIGGATRPVAIPAAVRLSTRAVDVRSVFPLDLEEYGVRGLRKLFGLFRMGPRVEVMVDLTLEREA